MHKRSAPPPPLGITEGPENSKNGESASGMQFSDENSGHEPFAAIFDNNSGTHTDEERTETIINDLDLGGAVEAMPLLLLL